MIIWVPINLGRALQRISVFQLSQHKPWSERDDSKLLDQRKLAKLQCLQISGQRNEGDNLNNVNCQINVSGK
jgi:hypothetical protein